MTGCHKILKYINCILKFPDPKSVTNRATSITIAAEIQRGRIVNQMTDAAQRKKKVHLATLLTKPL